MSEAQLMGKPKKAAPVKEIYFCTECQQVVIRHPPLGLEPFVKRCCGNEMILINNKCDICRKHIKGANHFQGQHHLAAINAAKVTKAAEIKFGMKR